jgi:hypothetical protein
MISSCSNKRKNVLDFEFFKLRKKEKLNQFIYQKVSNNLINLNNKPKSLNEIDISNRIHNIKQSVQRINKLISELKQISDKPNK